jgi:hypothetical protein
MYQLKIAIYKKVPIGRQVDLLAEKCYYFAKKLLMSVLRI